LRLRIEGAARGPAHTLFSIFFMLCGAHRAGSPPRKGAARDFDAKITKIRNLRLTKQNLFYKI